MHKCESFQFLREHIKINLIFPHTVTAMAAFQNAFKQMKSFYQNEVIEKMYLLSDNYSLSAEKHFKESTDLTGNVNINLFK